MLDNVKSSQFIPAKGLSLAHHSFTHCKRWFTGIHQDEKDLHQSEKYIQLYLQLSGTPPQVSATMSIIIMVWWPASPGKSEEFQAVSP